MLYYHDDDQDERLLRVSIWLNPQARRVELARAHDIKDEHPARAREIFALVLAAEAQAEGIDAGALNEGIAAGLIEPEYTESGDLAFRVTDYGDMFIRGGGQLATL